MKANEFIKKYGWDEAKAFLSFDRDVEIVYTASFFDDLKRIVEGHELVEAYGGLEKAKIRCYPAKHVTMESYHKLKQAIKDVESCQ